MTGHEIREKFLDFFAERGHRIVFFEWDAPWYAGKHRDLPPHACDYATIHLFSDWREARARLRRELRDADAALLGSYFRPGILAADFLAHEFPGIRVFYDIDTPISLKAYRERGAAEYLRADQIPLFHIYFSFSGGPALRELETRFGAPRAVPLYCAVDPRHHGRRRAHPDYRCAVGYMGTYARDRQAALDRLLNEPARRRPRLRFIVAGPKYPARIRWPANVRRFEHIPPPRHAAFYSSSRITLNLTRAEMRRWGWSPSVRIFEAAACGAAIASDSWPGLDQILQPRTEILPARSADDILADLELSDAELRTIGEAARARILAHHTTTARAAQFERELERVRP